MLPSRAPLVALPDNDNVEAWRALLTDFYTQNAPDKLHMVGDKMLAKFAGCYDELYGNLEAKYGKLGQPIARALAAAPARKGGGGGGGGSSKADSRRLGDWHDEFVELVSRVAPSREQQQARDPRVIAAKASDATNGLETSSFTVCTRIRPPLGDELSGGGENFVCVVPGGRRGEGCEHCEEALLLTPKVSLQGDPKLSRKAAKFDYVFGPEDSNEEVFRALGVPLVERVKMGMVGVVFAYGQTGSGKTHTMNGLMDGMVPLLFAGGGGGGGYSVKFSYFEALGVRITDCLAEGPQPPKGVQIGEGMDGRIITRNLSEHMVSSAAELSALVEVAKARRTTAATAMNDASSRAHGVAVITVGQRRLQVEGGSGSESGVVAACPVEGRLYVIDLAGSERAADSKKHDKARMDETKQINLSLMALKECIRARTIASAGGRASSSSGGRRELPHVPYRRSKLTLLLKDVFDIGCTRLCATVVIAAVSPLAKDVAHSANTIGYAAPLRVAAATALPMERDPRDPALWDNAQMAAWVGDLLLTQPPPPGAPAVDALALLGGMSGMQLCALPEPELFRRVDVQWPGAAGAAAAKALHTALWALIVDAKSRHRKADGSIVSEAEEEAERARVQAELDAKY